MLKIVIDKDCGNSPKNLLLQKMTIALAEGDIDYILGIVAEDIHWQIIGDKTIQGKASYAEALVEMKKNEVEKLTILHAFSHGKVGVVNGRKIMSDGSVIAFCDVYEYTGANFTRIKEITSYLVELE